ncbi:lysophosphatidylcholine acyltransferase 2B-like [Cervus elaphus]|uniref:lysophosphatidylcholine acyltransferase 2B-like n=1 Tax=Cervus elaphus TaxID=9860 RepID=UPI001CC2709F|nr:lysophosphatidylcholine acyltransferase 2B-like [Cervus elaphus]
MAQPTSDFEPEKLDSEPAVLSSMSPSLDSEPAVLSSRSPPLDSEPAVLSSTSPSSDSEPAVLSSTSPSLDSEPKALSSRSPPLDSEPAVLSSTSPPSDSEPAVSSSTSPPLDSEPAVSSSTSPPLDSEPAVSSSTSPPLDSEPAVLDAKAALESAFSRQTIKSLFPPAVDNPFTQHTHISAWRWACIVLMGTVLVPVRVSCIAFLFIFLWPVAALSTIGRRAQPTRPAKNWRGLMQPTLKFLFRVTFFLAGFLVKVKGKKATRDDARIFVAAPHSSFFDAIACVVAGLPSVVSASQNVNIPVAGRFLLSTQPVLVARDDPNSRRTTREEILKRVTSNRKWPQILIFPEGVCTNRSCLVTFKLGAFSPGVPVQPVLLRYPNPLDTVTWTWQGFTGFQACMLTLSQPFTRVEVEFMPVYIPNLQEKRDPVLFANTVRIIMANALGVPVTDHTYEDCRLMISAGNLQLPMEAGLVEFTKVSQNLKLDWDNIHQCLDKYAEIAVASKGGKIGIEEFANYLKLPISEPLQQLFALFDRNKDGTIDFREYVIGLTVLCNPVNTEKILQMSFKLFDLDKDGFITEQELAAILRAAFGVPDLDVSTLFREIAGPDSDHISYRTFKTFALKHPVYAKLFSSYLDLQAAYVYSLPQPVQA